MGREWLCPLTEFRNARRANLEATRQWPTDLLLCHRLRPSPRVRSSPTKTRRRTHPWGAVD